MTSLSHPLTMVHRLNLITAFKSASWSSFNLPARGVPHIDFCAVCEQALELALTLLKTQKQQADITCLTPKPEIM